MPGGRGEREVAGQFNAAAPRQRDVQDHEIRAVPRHRLEQVPAIRQGAHHLEFPGKQPGDLPQQGGMVIDKEHARAGC
ncbi:MAG: hypothetical protein M5U12_34900 [Verrucomicrobia bacterium]|nr:hypothetical protein [Verrucomicrobiota bacterium]